jgi:hypothetical protein
VVTGGAAGIGRSIADMLVAYVRVGSGSDCPILHDDGDYLYAVALV